MGLAPVLSVATIEDMIAGFLRREGWERARQSYMQEDFSGRLYRRLHGEGKGGNVLLMRMRAPEELGAFLRMRRLLDARGLRVPAVFASDADGGLALLEDLGDSRLDHLLDTGGDAGTLYRIVADALLHLHAAPPPDAAALGVPLYGEELFLRQVSLFLDVWERILPAPFTPAQRRAFLEAWPPLGKACRAAGSCLILRDLHAANVLYQENEKGHRRAGLIDFQDGAAGPLCYDLVSLLEDARRDLPGNLREELRGYYAGHLDAGKRAAFLASWPVIAALRHMRVIAIAGRRALEKRDVAAAGYCARSWEHLRKYAGVNDLTPLFRWLDQAVPPEFRGSPLR